MNVYCQQQGIPCNETAVDPMIVYCVSGLDEIQYRYEIGDNAGAQKLSYAILPQVYRLNQNQATFQGNLNSSYGGLWDGMKNVGANFVGSFVQSLNSVKLAPLGRVGVAPVGNIHAAPLMMDGMIYRGQGGNCQQTQQEMSGYQVVCVQQCVQTGGC